MSFPTSSAPLLPSILRSASCFIFIHLLNNWRKAGEDITSPSVPIPPPVTVKACLLMYNSTSQRYQININIYIYFTQAREVWSGLLIICMTMHNLETVSDRLTTSRMPLKGWRLIVRTDVMGICIHTCRYLEHLYNKTGQIFKSATHVTVHVNIFQRCNNYIHLQVISWLHCFASWTLTIKVRISLKRKKKSTETKQILISSSFIANGARVTQIIKTLFFKNHKRAHTWSLNGSKQN